MDYLIFGIIFVLVVCFIYVFAYKIKSSKLDEKDIEAEQQNIEEESGKSDFEIK